MWQCSPATNQLCCTTALHKDSTFPSFHLAYFPGPLMPLQAVQLAVNACSLLSLFVNAFVRLLKEIQITRGNEPLSFTWNKTSFLETDLHRQRRSFKYSGIPATKSKNEKHYHTSATVTASWTFSAFSMQLRNYKLNYKKKKSLWLISLISY